MKSLPLVICWPAVLLIAADKPEVDQSKKDLEMLQGTWSLVSMEAEGKKLPEEAYKGVKVVFEKNKMTMGKGDKTETATVILDASKKPKWINTTAKGGDELEGIYDLNGDDLKICLSKKRGDRPKEFITKADREHGLLVLKRQKQ
jgi:uncharacterized protein (TIGR03067 family)